MFVAAQVLDMRARLAFDSLLYAQRVFAVGIGWPIFLQNAIHLEEDAVKDSWFAGLRADLHWMHEIGSTALPANWNEGRYNAPH